MVRVLIPCDAAGGLIGKGGCVIRQMSLVSTCGLQFSDDSAYTRIVQEKILCIAGNVYDKLILVIPHVYSLAITSPCFLFHFVLILICYYCGSHSRDVKPSWLN